MRHLVLHVRRLGINQVALDADFIALSFVRSASDVEDVRRIMAEEGAHLPVIATSRDDGTRQRARDLGADEALPTPLVLADLQSSMLRLLGRPARIG